jgi:hypothetical protein
LEENPHFCSSTPLTRSYHLLTNSLFVESTTFYYNKIEGIIVPKEGGPHTFFAGDTFFIKLDKSKQIVLVFSSLLYVHPSKLGKKKK